MSPPIGYTDRDGRPGGFSVEVLTEAARRAGLRLEWVVVGNARENNEALRRGAIDVVAGYDSPERRQDFVVSTPWWSSALTVVVKESSDLLTDADLKGRRLSVPIGAGPLLADLFGAGSLLPVKSAVESVQAVCAGSSDAGIVATMYLRELLFANDRVCSGIRLRTIDTSIKMDYLLIARREMAEPSARLRDAVDALTMDGTLAAIASRHPPVSTPQATQLAELIRARYEHRLWVSSGVAGAFLFLCCTGIILVLVRARRTLRAVNAELERDIAERRRVEEALLESEDRFRSLIQSAPDGVFVQSDGRFLFLNPAMARLLGAAAPEELLDRSIYDRIAPEFHPAVEERIRTIRATGLPVLPMEQVYLRVDGSSIPVETAAIFLRFQHRDAILVFVRDITARKEAEKQQQALQSALFQSQKMEMVGRLAGGVAHDFNNILAAMMMHIGLLQECPPEGQELSAALGELEMETRRAAALTKQLLIFSHRSPFSRQPLELNERVTDLLRMLSRLLGETVVLRFQAPDYPIVLRADAGMIEQCIMNLVLNARDAMPEGGMIRISTGLYDGKDADRAGHPSRRSGLFASLEIADTGHGMDAETRSHLFEPFFTTKPSGKGTGLGLATVHRIVMQHHGWVEVESEVGQGARFRLFFPAEREVRPTARQAGETDIPERGTEWILMVEDDGPLRQATAQGLEGLGYTVVQAASGPEAWEQWRVHGDRIDLLFSDMVMPGGLSGLDLHRQLSALKPDLKTLLTSGYSLESLQPGNAGQVGIAYLPKPYKLRRLAQALRQCLDEERPGNQTG